MNELDDHSEQVRSRREGGGNSYSRTDGSMRRVLEALVIGAVGVLSATVWNLRETAAVQQVSLQFMQKQLDKLDQRQDVLEGRITRGELLDEPPHK